MTQDHGQVAQNLSVIWLLLQRRLEAILGGRQIIFLPVHCTEGIPRLSVGGNQLERLAQEVFSLAGVLGEEHEDTTAEVHELGLLLLVLNKVERFGIENSGSGIEGFPNFLDPILTEIGAVQCL